MRNLVWLAVLVGAVLPAAWTAKAQDAPTTVVLFNPATGEAPESVNFDRFGNMYVSLALTGEIRKIAPDGAQSTVAFLPLDPAPQCNNSFGLGIQGGITLDPLGNVFVSVNSCDPLKLGVWKVTPQGGASLLANLPFPAAPNGIAFHAGSLYVADASSISPAVWKIDASTGAFAIWTQDPLLSPPPNPPPLTPGPNGLQIFQNEVYVAVSYRSTIVAFQIGSRGEAQPGRVHANVNAGIGMGVDDFAFDVLGNIYASTDPFQKLLKIHSDGTFEELFFGCPLDGPTAVAFGVRAGDNQNIYVTNGAFPFFAHPCGGVPRPSVLKLNVGSVGAPR
jgi:sugar lactone lactonase YvrE